QLGFEPRVGVQWGAGEAQPLERAGRFQVGTDRPELGGRLARPLLIGVVSAHSVHGGQLGGAGRCSARGGHHRGGGEGGEGEQGSSHQRLLSEHGDVAPRLVQVGPSAADLAPARVFGHVVTSCWARRTTATDSTVASQVRVTSASSALAQMTATVSSYPRPSSRISRAVSTSPLTSSAARAKT